MSESLPAQARKVSSWLLGWLIQALKKLNSPSVFARAFASLYTGSKLVEAVNIRSLKIRGKANIPLVMLNKAYNTILLCQFDEVDVVREQLSRRLRDQDMQFPLESVFCDGVVGAYQASQPRDDTYAQRSGRTVGREDDDRLSGLHLVHRNLVFIRVRTVQPLFGGKLTSFWIRLVDLRVVVEATYQSAITQGLW